MQLRSETGAGFVGIMEAQCRFYFIILYHFVICGACLPPYLSVGHLEIFYCTYCYSYYCSRIAYLLLLLISLLLLLASLLLLIPALCRGVLGDGWAIRRIWPTGWGSVKRILHVQFSVEIKSILI